MEKGSVMSVFRYGLVGPNFQPNLLSERAAVPSSWGNSPMPVERKGNWLIFQYSSMRAMLRWRHRIARICLLVDCRTQCTFRVLLTRILNILSPEPIIGCGRVLAWQRIGLAHLVARSIWVISKMWTILRRMRQILTPTLCSGIYPTWGTVPETAAGLQG